MHIIGERIFLGMFKDKIDAAKAYGGCSPC